MAVSGNDSKAISHNILFNSGLRWFVTLNIGDEMCQSNLRKRFDLVHLHVSFTAIVWRGPLWRGTRFIQFTG